MTDFQAAMAARSLRTVRAELEFLADTNHITPSQLSSILSNLPQSDIASTLSSTHISPQPTRSRTEPVAQIPAPPSNFSEKTTPFNEKANQIPTPTPSYPSAPPAYSHPPTLSVVLALYPYAASDAGDLALQPNDTINVTEYVNEDWWRGVNPSTGQTGIFPKAYVKTVESANTKEGYGYGNIPLQVANSGSSHGPPQPAQGQYVGPPEEPSKMEQNGKKFGKKLGNAAIFGAGATIGGKIVNGIF